MIKNNNIDLTEHRDFGERIFAGLHIMDSRVLETIQERVNAETFGTRIPWNVYPLQRHFSFDFLMPLGNGEERKRDKEMYYWGTQDATTCDSCGVKITNIPWNRNSGLCEECRVHMKRARGIFPWDWRESNNGI